MTTHAFAFALHTSAGAEASRCVAPEYTSPSPGIGSTERSCVTSESYVIGTVVREVD